MVVCGRSPPAALDHSALPASSACFTLCQPLLCKPGAPLSVSSPPASADEFVAIFPQRRLRLSTHVNGASSAVAVPVGQLGSD